MWLAEVRLVINAGCSCKVDGIINLNRSLAVETQTRHVASSGNGGRRGECCNAYGMRLTQEPTLRRPTSA